MKKTLIEFGISPSKILTLNVSDNNVCEYLNKYLENK